MAVGLIIGIVLGIVSSALVIWIVGKLGLGMELKGLRPAIIAAIVIGLLNALASTIWAALGNEAFSIPTQIIITAAFLYFVGPKIKDFRVKGFIGALVASLAIAGIAWLINMVVGQLF